MRPYYTDPYTVEFKSEITKSFTHGGQPAVLLQESYFYPTSGGQEHDAGSINGVKVVDVQEEDEEIIHILSAPLDVGPAECMIDKDRRLSNMQQHTGQHILSAAFENLFDIETVSSRLGESTGTIDLSRQPTESEIDKAVSVSNRILCEDRNVIVHFADQNEISKFKLRKPPKVEGTVRIIEVKDFDFSPCGGTHCTHTSEVGVILTGNLEKIKASLTRIEFYCGVRAIENHNTTQQILRECTRLLSTQLTDLPDSIQKLKDHSQEKDSKLKTLTERVLSALCDELKEDIQRSTEGFTVMDLGTRVEDSNELRYLASCVAKGSNKSFGFWRRDGDSAQMIVNLKMEDSKSLKLIEAVRSQCAAKGGGRSGFYTLNFAGDKLANVLSVIGEAVKNV